MVPVPFPSPVTIPIPDPATHAIINNTVHHATKSTTATDCNTQRHRCSSSTLTAAHQPAAHMVAAPAVSAEATVSALLHCAYDAAMRRWSKAAHTSNGCIFPPVPGLAVTPRPAPLSATVVLHAIVTRLQHTQPKLGSYYGFIVAILETHAAAPSTKPLLLQPALPPPPPQAHGGLQRRWWWWRRSRGQATVNLR